VAVRRRPPAIVGARTGDLVTLLNTDRRKLGEALYDADSPIALRVLATRRSEPAGPALWRRRVADAWDLRHAALDLRATDAFRVLHGEGDRLPGVVVDHYAGFLIIKLDTPAWLPHLTDLTAVLSDIIKPRGIFFKGMTGDRGDQAHRVLAGDDPPEHIAAREHGMHFSWSTFAAARRPACSSTSATTGRSSARSAAAAACSTCSPTPAASRWPRRSAGPPT
jgi:23S rRNA (cytosine1962-C5)-methyltransferase